MDPTEMKEWLEGRIADAERRQAKPGSLCATFVGRSAASLGVRPQVLDHKADGTKVYALTLKQARTLRDRLASGLERP